MKKTTVKKWLMLPFHILGLAIFIVGRITKPMQTMDVAFMRGLELRSQLREFKMLEFENATEQAQVDAQISKMDEDVERIINDGRKRQYSPWRTDFLALGIVILGAFVVLIRALKSVPNAPG